MRHGCIPFCATTSTRCPVLGSCSEAEIQTPNNGPVATTGCAGRCAVSGVSFMVRVCRQPVAPHPRCSPKKQERPRGRLAERTSTPALSRAVQAARPLSAVASPPIHGICGSLFLGLRPSQSRRGFPILMACRYTRHASPVCSEPQMANKAVEDNSLPLSLLVYS